MSEKAQNEQILNSTEQQKNTDNSTKFEMAVLEAATKHAQQILQKAKEEGELEYEELIKNDKADVVAAHKTEIDAALRRKVAGEKQNNMKKLLVYRKQLVNGLFAQCEESLLQFTASDKYTNFCIDKIKQHIKNSDKNYTVLIKSGDDLLIENIKKMWPDVQTEVDDTIKIGGAKIRCGNILHNETLDRRLEDERVLFVQRCNLHVSTQETETNNEQ